MFRRFRTLKGSNFGEASPFEIFKCPTKEHSNVYDFQLPFWALTFGPRHDRSADFNINWNIEPDDEWLSLFVRCLLVSVLVNEWTEEPGAHNCHQHKSLPKISLHFLMCHHNHHHLLRSPPAESPFVLPPEWEKTVCKERGPNQMVPMHLLPEDDGRLKLSGKKWANLILLHDVTP